LELRLSRWLGNSPKYLKAFPWGGVQLSSFIKGSAQASNSLTAFPAHIKALPLPPNQSYCSNKNDKPSNQEYQKIGNQPQDKRWTRKKIVKFTAPEEKQIHYKSGWIGTYVEAKYHTDDSIRLVHSGHRPKELKPTTVN
jgi:hypothetical protein